MSEGIKIPRLLAAAIEFNVGKETLIDFLSKQGFELESKPNPKLNLKMYEALQEEFAKDKATKIKSDAIELPKPVGGEKKKSTGPTKTEKPVEKEVEQKEVEEKEDSVQPNMSAEPQPSPEVVETSTSPTPVEENQESAATQEEKESLPVVEEKKESSEESAAKADSKPIEKESVPVSEKDVEKESQKTEEIKSSEATKSKEDEKKPEPAISEKKEPTQQETKVEEKESSTSSNQEENKQESAIDEAEEPEHIEIKAPKLEGPKVLDKIDLSSINTSTRPKKGSAKKAEEKKLEERRAEEKKKAEQRAAAKKEEEAKANAAAEAKDKKESPKAPSKEQSATPVAPPTAPEEPVVEHIEMKAPKLEGPKVIGKIELPVSTPSNKHSQKEKRKRKRIPLDKKPGTTTAKGGNQQGADGNKQQGRDNRPNRNQRLGNKQSGQDRRRHGHKAPANVPQEIDAKEIQEKIKETQAKLAGGNTRNRNLKAKYRRNKREEMAEKRAAEERSEENKVIQLTEFISVSEFANLLDVSFADIISKCMNLGIMVSINQRLDAEVIELVASEFDVDVEFINLDEKEEEEEEIEDDEADLVERAPVVTIMGHVDHGKTSLLDYIRNATVVAGEAGGITQHIGAYRVTTQSGKNITFLDTPGHEAFTAMRARGAKAADIAIIVVAADDAIMPQTREAISHAQAAGLPMVFAINKIDKETANPEKIKEQLANMNILVEDWGGSFQSQEISAKKGINIDLLLEKVLLEAELLELKANPNRDAIGSVIEASLDKGRGYVSTILVQTGTLHVGDVIVAGQFYGKVKAMNNERGQRIKMAGPSTPAQVLGLNGAAQAGEKIKVYADESEAKAIANHRAQILREQGLRARKHITLDEIGRRLALGNFKELNVIIKADVDGSAEALSDSLQKLSTEEVVVNVVLQGVGQITESDVNLASASDAIILGFQVRPSLQAARLAEQENIEIRHYSIIYDAIDEIKSAMEGMLEPKLEKRIVGNIEVRETYKVTSIGTIAGCYVLDGKFQRNTKINVIRDGVVKFTGELASLKRFKDDVKEVNAGYECGVTIKGFNDIQVGDIIEGYEEVEVKRKL